MQSLPWKRALAGSKNASEMSVNTYSMRRGSGTKCAQTLAVVAPVPAPISKIRQVGRS